MDNSRLLQEKLGGALRSEGLAQPIRNWFIQNAKELEVDLQVREYEEGDSAICVMLCPAWDEVYLMITQGEAGVVFADVVRVMPDGESRLLFSVDWTESDDVEMSLSYLWNGLQGL